MHLDVGGTSIVRLNKGLAVNSLSDPLGTLFTPHFCMENQSIILVLNIISSLLKILLCFLLSSDQLDHFLKMNLIQLSQMFVSFDSAAVPKY